MRMRFGTDGLRGRANHDLTPEVALRLGRAAATVLPGDQWIIGWDTRNSSPMLAAAFAAGVASAGKRITQLGGVPTAAVSYLCRAHRLPGAMVTASHNPYPDNGIKTFGPEGEKTGPEVERAIEELLNGTWAFTPPPACGDIIFVAPQALRDEYRTWLTERAAAIPGNRLRIAVDCAHGASYDTAPGVLAATGARVTAIGNQPDGLNINEGYGSTSLDRLKETVALERLDFGLAFDGDADRLLAIDEHGETVDGDQIIAILAHRMTRLGTLRGGGVVVTEWSNLGMLRSLRAAGMAVETCEVGDKAVAETMRKTGYVLGGEQSGHVILSGLLPVGDGISTAVELVGAIVAAGLPLSELAAAAMHKMPQMTTKVAVTSPPRVVVAALEAEHRAINDELGERGRLVLRASGTEPVVRVMVEAENLDEVRAVVDRAVALVSAARDAVV